MDEPEPLIGIVIAAGDETESIQPTLETLRHLGCPFEIRVASAWATPQSLLDWAKEAEWRGVRVLLATAGAEPHLPGLLAAAGRLPVIAIPLGMTTMAENEVLRAALRASPLAPVAAVEPGDMQSAALLGLRILAASDSRWKEAIDRYQRAMIEEIAERDQALALQRGLHPPSETPPPKPVRRAGGVETQQARRASDQPEAAGTGAAPFADDERESARIRPFEIARPLAGQPAPSRQGPPKPVPPAAAPMLGRRSISPDDVDVGLIEAAVECLLDGGVVALPTETVYGLAVDATNPEAVERLFELKGRPRAKAITLMVDSPKMLALIACNLTVEARRLMEAFWPGPLTIVFRKREGEFDHVGATDTIGVRLPDHAVPLAIVQELARPIACTSANLSGGIETFSADQVEESFGDKVNLILDAGDLSPSPPSTVIDVSEEPFKILRLGSITQDQLAAIVGDKLEQQS